MKNYFYLEAFALVYISYLFFVSEAFIFGTTQRPSAICQDNRDADPFIQGDTQNAVLNFLHVIRNKGSFALIGDASLISDGCRKISEKYKHRKGREYNGQMWTLDCWDPFECSMIEETTMLKLLPITVSSSAPVRVRTVLLPLDQSETSSYTFLPSTSHDHILFVTAMLSGCSFFVAKPNSASCNLIVIHANYRCEINSSGVDYNHQQAMAVLEEVHSTNTQCRYQIYRRWAVDYRRPAIEAAGYHYANRIFYYNIEHAPNFLYANNLHAKWQFCMIVAAPNPPPETCYDI